MDKFYSITQQGTKLSFFLPEHGKDVSGASRILTTMEPRAKLTNWHQQVDVVTSNEVLG